MSAAAEPAYEGLVTRAIAFCIDAAIINGVAIVVAAGISLALSVLSVSGWEEDVLIALGGTAFVLWAVGYFVTFWSSTGQTPGSRVMRVRVCRADDLLPLRPARALLRFARPAPRRPAAVRGLPHDPGRRPPPRAAGHAGRDRGGVGPAGEARALQLERLARRQHPHVHLGSQLGHLSGERLRGL